VKSLSINVRGGVALLGTLTLWSVAALPGHAQDAVDPSLSRVEGVLADAGAVGSFVVRPLAGDPVKLTFGPNTHWHAGVEGQEFHLPAVQGVAKTAEAPPAPPEPPTAQPPAPSEPPTTGPPAPPGPPTVDPPVPPDAPPAEPPVPTEPPTVEPPAPSLPDLVGEYARATYDANHVAQEVWLRDPQPLTVGGVVSGVADPGFVLLRENGQQVGFSVKSETRLFLDGRPVSVDRLAKGDRAEVFFYLTPAENLALFVRARTAPPVSFEGVVVPSAGVQQVTVGGSFSAANAAGLTLNFKVTSETAIRLLGKPATVADLTPGCRVNVLYRVRGDQNWALRVSAYKPKEPHGTGPGEKSKGGKNTGNGEKPKPSTGRPNGDKPKTNGDSPKPHGDKPHGNGDKPKGTGDKPKGKVDATKPNGDKPKGTGDKPKPGSDKPKGETPKPNSNKPKPNGDKPKPNTTTPKGHGDKPRGGGDKPKGGGDQPTVNGDQGNGHEGQNSPPADQPGSETPPPAGGPA
jgi:hypothetical protein